MPTPTSTTNSKQWTEHKKTVPASALCMNIGAFEFADDVQPGDAKGKTVPVKLLGRTGKPIAHWFWGNVVHDMAGMKLHKDSIPIDYCHDCDEVLGYLDKFDTASGDLVATGALVPFADDDRANEVVFKSKQKVPYEASINFNGPVRLEELDAGTSTTVNGNVVQGPALIIREWTLRGIAICPYGADMNTNTEFSNTKDGATASIDVTIFRESTAMPQNATQTNGATTTEQNKPAAGDPAVLKQGDTPAPVTPAVPAAPVAGSAKPGQEYIDAFGDAGARWFFEGKPFAQCTKEFIGQKDTRITELEAKVKELKEQIAAMPRGNDAVTFQSEKQSTNPREAQFAQVLSPGMSRFAASLKLPPTNARATTEAKK